jgi:solute carrier family 8 (sodium/calcium exchanger)
MLAALTNKKLMNGIKKASPIGQTSCLEGFHSVLNQFSPKMIGYSYPGMFRRYSDFCNSMFVYLSLFD